MICKINLLSRWRAVTADFYSDHFLIKISQVFQNSNKCSFQDRHVHLGRLEEILQKSGHLVHFRVLFLDSMGDIQIIFYCIVVVRFITGEVCVLNKTLSTGIVGFMTCPFSTAMLAALSTHLNCSNIIPSAARKSVAHPIVCFICCCLKFLQLLLYDIFCTHCALGLRVFCQSSKQDICSSCPPYEVLKGTNFKRCGGSCNRKIWHSLRQGVHHRGLENWFVWSLWDLLFTMEVTECPVCGSTITCHSCNFKTTQFQNFNTLPN